MTDYWFFLSYSRPTQASEAFVEQFFRDLSLRVVDKAGLPHNTKPEAIGYWDQTSNALGDHWPTVLRTALETTKILVCLYDFRYFQSAFCGKEMQAMRLRLEHHRQARGTTKLRRRPILPILWDPYRLPRPLPDALKDIQYTYKKLGEAYRANGLRTLITQSQYRDQYDTFLSQFAELLVDSALDGDLSTDYALPDPKDIPNIFEKNAQPAGHDTLPAAESGPGIVRFFFVAGKRNEMSSVRAQSDFYGTDDLRRDWRPYLGTLAEAVGLLTQRISTEEGLLFECVPPDSELIGRLRAAEEAQNVVVLLVDPWTARLQPYQTHLSSYDSSAFINTAVLVIWNDGDSETATEKTVLSGALGLTFKRHILLRNPHFHNGTTTADALERDLRETIHQVRKTIN